MADSRPSSARLEAPPPEAAPEAGPRKPQTIRGIVKRNILAGILVLMPLGMCLWVLTLVWGWVVEPLGGFMVGTLGKVVPEVVEDAEGRRLVLERTSSKDEEGRRVEVASTRAAGGWNAFMSRIFHPKAADSEEIAVAIDGQPHIFHRLPGMAWFSMIFGFVLVLMLVFVFGMLMRMLLGRTVVKWGERILTRIPLIRTVYVGTKQLLETLFSEQKRKFQGTVLVQYPRPGMWAMAFVTSTIQGELKAGIQQDSVSIFLPTTPNPTSGYLLLVPRRDVVPLSMSVEDAVKYIISGGIVPPPEPAEASTRGGWKPPPTGSPTQVYYRNRLLAEMESSQSDAADTEDSLSDQ